MDKQNKRDISAENTRRRKKSKSRRAKKQRENAVKRSFPWKGVLITLGVVIVILAVLALIFGSEPKVYHQMPKVTPPETVESAVDGV